MTTCEIVAERIALGEALSEHADHAASCERCRELVAVAGTLGATHHAVDPGLGFAARMTVGAQHRLVVRRRRRIVAGVTSTAAAAALAVFVFTRPPSPTPESTVAVSPIQDPADQPTALNEEELRGLVQLADTERTLRSSANWRHTTKPLRPYKKILKGLTP